MNPILTQLGKRDRERIEQHHKIPDDAPAAILTDRLVKRVAWLKRENEGWRVRTASVDGYGATSTLFATRTTALEWCPALADGWQQLNLLEATEGTTQ